MDRSMAYFTDPMGDEFKKAIEEAMEEIENEESTKKDSKKIEKSKMKHLSTKTKRSLK
ncbi:MAG TPA: hypothetical protein VNE86_00535 [Nitrososphaerales archaeon]|nr:hypothetical protein [Nitrososphaerales archaeon]